MSELSPFVRAGRPQQTRWLWGAGMHAVPYRLRGPAVPDPQRRPVLITHGLSAAANTAEATLSAEPGAERTLVGSLETRGADVWLLDWRGTCDATVIARHRAALGQQPRADQRAPYRFHRVAQQDVFAAARAVADAGYTRPIGLLAHCMGAAATSIALAGAAPELATLVDRLVLTTVGLFFEPPQVRQVLADEHVVIHNRESFRHWIPTLARNCTPDQLEGWPWGPLEPLFDTWRAAGAGPARLNRVPDAPEDFQRQAFLYGEPFHPRLLPLLYPTPGARGVQGLFGPIQVDLLQEAARFVRARMAVRPGAAGTPWVAQRSAIDGFDALERVTLITGHLNRLWHRRSIDQMAEWLWRELPDRGQRVHKHVIAGFAHQDLFWAPDAAEVVFPPIWAALGL